MRGLMEKMLEAESKLKKLQGRFYKVQAEQAALERKIIDARAEVHRIELDLMKPPK